MARAHHASARARSRKFCDGCKRFISDFWPGEYLEHVEECAKRYRYKCPVCGWRTGSMSRLIYDHQQHDPTLTQQSFLKWKPIAPKK